MNGSRLHIPQSDPRQDAIMARALRNGVRFKVRLSRVGWHITAKGPEGSVTMLLPRARRSIFSPLVALCQLVDSSAAKEGAA